MESVKFNDDDIVISCKYIEKGLSFQLDGAHCCCLPTFMSPTLITADEINNNCITHEFIVERRKELFYALNGRSSISTGDCAICKYKYKTNFKDISFEYYGGDDITINVQHFTQCNLSCSYCCYAQENKLIPSAYSVKKLISLIECFSGKFLPGAWVTFSGGEPTILYDYQDLVRYFFSQIHWEGCIFSNAIKFSPEICEGLRTNKLYLTTSLDAGLPSTFKKIRGANALYKVVDTLIQYRNSGTKNLWLKYIITPENLNDDDLFSFVFLMVALKPDKVYITPEFPYGDKTIPYASVQFGAKMWYYLSKYGNINIHILTDDNVGDSKFIQYSEDIRKEYAKLIEKEPIDDIFNLNKNIIPLQNMDRITREREQKTCRIIQRQLSLVKNASLASRIAQHIFIMVGALFSQELRETLIISHSGFFDKIFYYDQYSDVMGAKLDPIRHYVRHGAKEGRNPAPWFETTFYVSTYPDVAASGINPFYHYIRFGYKEGRQTQSTS